jgi:hypothetical protein
VTAEGGFLTIGPLEELLRMLRRCLLGLKSFLVPDPSSFDCSGERSRPGGWRKGGD